MLSELYRYPTYYGIRYVTSGVPEVRGTLIREDGDLDPDIGMYRYVSESTASNFPRVRLNAGDFVMSVRGTLGKIGIVPPWLEGAVITANLIRVQFASLQVAPRWAKHWLLSRLFQDRLDMESSATTIKTIQAPTLEKISIQLPPLPEQHEIAAILDAADEAIRATERVIAKLKMMKQGLLHDLLTRGLDENGELRDPERRPELFKGSPLGLIPVNWTIGTIAEEVHLDSGQHIPSDLYNSKGNGVPYFTGPMDFRDGVAVVTNFTTRPKVMCRPGDVLITVKGSGCGKVAITHHHACISRQLMAVRPHDSISDFWYYLLLSRQRCFENLASGSAIPGISRDQILGTGVLLPPEDERNQIASVLESHEERIRTEKLALDKLHKVKRGLMDDLLTGRVRVAMQCSAERNTNDGWRRPDRPG